LRRWQAAKRQQTRRKQPEARQSHAAAERERRARRRAERPAERRDPESKGIVEAKVRYVKKNALQGRDEDLTCWEDYGRLAISREFHLQLRRRPAKSSVHLRRLLNLVRIYGREDVVAAIARANEYQTYDAAYVETILLQERRRRELPSPISPRPKRQELMEDIDLEEPDPAVYDRLCDHGQQEKS
jgi:hypothetical protein